MRQYAAGELLALGECLNPAGRPALQRALRLRDAGPLLALARSQKEAGAELLDVNAHLPGTEEPQLLAWAVQTVQTAGLPLLLDAAEPRAIAAGLEACGGNGVINSVNGTCASMHALLPFAKAYGVPLVAQPWDETGLPDTAEGRFAVAERLLNRAVQMGIPAERLWIDCLALPRATRPEQAAEALRAVSLVRERLGAPALLGISNFSYGIENRETVNREFLRRALEAGVTRPIFNPLQSGMMETLAAFRRNGQ